MYENQFLFLGFTMKSCDPNYFLSETEKGSFEFILSLCLSLNNFDARAGAKVESKFSVRVELYRKSRWN